MNQPEQWDSLSPEGHPWDKTGATRMQEDLLLDNETSSSVSFTKRV